SAGQPSASWWPRSKPAGARRGTRAIRSSAAKAARSSSPSLPGSAGRTTSRARSLSKKPEQIKRRARREGLSFSKKPSACLACSAFELGFFSVDGAGVDGQSRVEGVLAFDRLDHLAVRIDDEGHPV